MRVRCPQTHHVITLNQIQTRKQLTPDQSFCEFLVYYRHLERLLKISPSDDVEPHATEAMTGRRSSGYRSVDPILLSFSLGFNWGWCRSLRFQRAGMLQERRFTVIRHVIRQYGHALCGVWKQKHWGHATIFFSGRAYGPSLLWIFKGDDAVVVVCLY